jgi:hypothetical protein
MITSEMTSVDPNVTIPLGKKVNKYLIIRRRAAKPLFHCSYLLFPTHKSSTFYYIPNTNPVLRSSFYPGPGIARDGAQGRKAPTRLCPVM